MFDEKTIQIRRLMTVIDLMVTILAYGVAFWLQALLFQQDADNKDLFSHLALLPLIWAFLLYTLPKFGAYRSPRVATTFDYAWAVTRSVSVAIVVLLTLLFLLKIHYISRIVIAGFACIDIVFLFMVRLGTKYYFRRSLAHGENYLKVLIIGTGHRALTLSKSLLQRSEWGIDIIGHLDPDPKMKGQTINNAKVLGAIDDISQVLKDNVIDEVIMAVPRKMISDAEGIAYACQEEGVKLRLMADVYDLQVARVSLVELGNIPLLTLEPVALDPSKLMIKRLIDLVFSILITPVLLPLLAVTALAIKFDSPGPVFFIQERVGLKKRSFRMYKFRSMYSGSEEKIKELEAMNEAEGPIFKITNDPRITRVGKFIRKTSLDEFPQFINVLKGEMSLVGPRPMSLRDVDLFDRGIQRKRFSVKPGLTCLWQISGRSNLPFTKWLELDLEYIEKWSLRLDFKILLKTVPEVLKGSGAM